MKIYFESYLALVSWKSYGNPFEIDGSFWISLTMSFNSTF